MEITTRKAAERLGVSQQRVRDMVEDGTLAGRKVVLAGRSALRPVVLVEEESVERRRVAEKRMGGYQRRADPKVRKKMAAAGYMTTTEAATAIGLERKAATWLAQLVRRGKVAGVREGITFIHKDEVDRLRREREAKIEAVV